MIKKLLLPVGLCLSLVFGMLTPAAGIWLAEHKTPYLFIAAIFLVNGYQTELHLLVVTRRLLGAFLICGLVGYLGGALLGSGVARALDLDPDLAAGIVVISTMAPTLSSVIVITEAAKGNTTWSILLTVGLNLAGVVIVPNLLALSLPGREVSLPVLRLVLELILSVLLPFGVGVAARHIVKRPPTGFINQVPTLLVITLSYLSFATGREKLLASTIASLVLLVVALLALHIVLLIAALGLSVVFRYKTPERKAIVFISGQKTLPAAIAIVTSLGFPAAAVPCVIYHFSQILFDAFIASFWRARSESAERAAENVTPLCQSQEPA